jgi:hypothetical protein
MKRSALCIFSLLALTSAVACKGAGPEGTYKLDKAETKKAMEAEVAKMPADQQGMAKFGLAMVDAMDITFKLNPDGKAEMSSSVSMEPGKPPTTKTEAVTWAQSGDGITVSGGKEPMTCKLAGKQLTCTSGSKGKSLSFIKQ